MEMPEPPLEPDRRPPVLRRAFAAGAAILGGEGLAGMIHPALGEALAAADVIAPLAIALILLAVTLFGSDRIVERAFRLLRWAANRPEPAAPDTSSAALRPDSRAAQQENAEGQNVLTS
jgi:hypothetical protein